MARQVALLRGINVGGHRKVPMARLRTVLEELGYRDVETYVQSGNVVFSGPGRPPEQTASALERDLEAAFGFDVGVVVRTRDEIAELVAANPLGAVADDPARHLVLFLASVLDPERVAGLDPADFAPESFALRPREVCLWAPRGLRDSKVIKALSERRLGVVATGRNWRTVERLLAMADGSAG